MAAKQKQDEFSIQVWNIANAMHTDWLAGNTNAATRAACDAAESALPDLKRWEAFALLDKARELAKTYRINQGA